MTIRGRLTVVILTAMAAACGDGTTDRPADTGAKSGGPAATHRAVDTSPETPPALPLASLLPADVTQGGHFTVDDPVPTDGLMGKFTIRSDAGTFEATGRKLARIRIGELAAIAEIEATGKTERFIDAFGRAAKRPVDSAVNIVLHPVDTVKGIPDGASRFFGRVKRGAEHLVQTVTDGDAGTAERVGAAGKQVAGTTADAFGYEQERRSLAKKLKVDPYTTNPVLAAKLDQAAWVAFSGRVGLDVLFAAVVPGSLAISAINATNDLVWDTPRGDLVVRNAAALQAMGVSPDTVTKLQANPAWSLSLQTALVQALGRLADTAGRPEIVEFAAEADAEDKARFIADTTDILARYHESVRPIASVSAPGPIIARDRDGTVVVPAAVDYVAWTEKVRDFANRPELQAASRDLRLAGKTSPRARENLETLGWKIHEDWDH